MNSTESTGANKLLIPLLILFSCVVVVGLAFGTRQSMGLFMRPITVELGWGRETLSLIIGLQALLNGFAAPFAGAISDKWGTGRTIFGGGLLYATGLVIMAESNTVGGMMLGGSLLVGMGISACGMPVMLSAVGRIAPEQSRSTWLGIVTAGATGGQLLIIPLVQSTINAQGWQMALYVLAVCFIIIVPVAILLGYVGKNRAVKKDTQTLSQAVLEARGHSGYWLLLLGFFVCGFQVQFIATHLPSFIADSGGSNQLGATALILIALFNMLGAWVAGYLGGRFRKKYLLTGIYLMRALGIIAFMLLPVTTASVLAFSAFVGFFWLATVPLTSGLIVQVFGVRYMATLYAIVYVSHQLGNFMGAWVGGSVYDATGSYTQVWWIAAMLGFIAAALHYPIKDQPVKRLADTTS